jgi:hypothetical protein
MRNAVIWILTPCSLVDDLHISPSSHTVTEVKSRRLLLIGLEVGRGDKNCVQIFSMKV